MRLRDLGETREDSGALKMDESEKKRAGRGSKYEVVSCGA